ncbi:phospholipase A [Ancylomarina sp. 16SWW S1-10-2]|uniref:phospholipase A n=1 Tax=Ancylomarina sp. 16SWW S1-10-2 TaxID=2499681 RepID=UPI0012AE9075|nr:phospholipase A [Ancylomarina sp. 16SWW S1-10-2]MRT94571.1 phospholipase [Ancylomarina sp. 16SWW S1-10-2]
MKLKIYFLLIISFAFVSSSVAQNLFKKQQISLLEQWELVDTVKNQKGLFQIKQYRPVYILMGNYTNDINEKPQSENPNNSVTEAIALDQVELKFQLSFKTKVFNNMLGPKLGGDIWMAYTQTSRWQVYNDKLSRPFRETNYEPEIMYIMPTPYKICGLKGLFAGIGFNHQSNGRSDPTSRSWNRVVAQIAWESENLSLILKPWFRIHESAEDDNNPGIENYMGRGELMAAYGKGRHDLSLIVRHSMRLGENNRGSLQVDYAFQIWDNLKLNAQLFHGYGESLIDYNHKQTTFGIGLSLTQWR